MDPYRNSFFLEPPEYDRLRTQLAIEADQHVQNPDRAKPVFQIYKDAQKTPRFEIWHYLSATLDLKRNSEESLTIHTENVNEAKRCKSLLTNIAQIPIKMTPINPRE
jgi:hypothetical protein